MRIEGITLPDEKRIDIALTAVYGIGRVRAKKVLDKAEVEHGKKSRDISPEEEVRIREQVEVFTIEGDLKREVANNVKRLRDIRAYRGIRHGRRLPSRGQRTKTNSRTRRGNVRQTMGTGKRKVDKK